jgi:hypothetical protein
VHPPKGRKGTLRPDGSIDWPINVSSTSTLQDVRQGDPFLLYLAPLVVIVGIVAGVGFASHQSGGGFSPAFAR